MVVEILEAQILDTRGDPRGSRGRTGGSRLVAGATGADTGRLAGRAGPVAVGLAVALAATVGFSAGLLVAPARLPAAAAPYVVPAPATPVSRSPQTSGLVFGAGRVAGPVREDWLLADALRNRADLSYWITARRR
jgi:hypothetical protein